MKYDMSNPFGGVKDVTPMWKCSDCDGTLCYYENDKLFHCYSCKAKWRYLGFKMEKVE